MVSNHTDFSVTPLDPFLLLWTSMARTTRSGVTLGDDQRVDAYAALRALTVGPAHQVFEEQRKGRIAVGLLADLVVLSADPLKVSLEAVRDIHVLETIKEGVTVFRRIVGKSN
ncbi:amidohydrolase family protein [Aeromicrobium sp. UC242_57]|uniref:amidohydrolase family protein n=1 Tax=Aeromicrobium sp. UC242_57 TaxID=3374624 RepID=UPI0037BAB7ED